ncbi:MAG TPA: serine/threonine-protein kinase [Aliidongia sp.]|uniref:serine/threonine-protein kinase n=1 Tax=Aliidongia sp. TaxID=1914230 RepID=UPI002DDDAF5A|nr:serine/threonine-protein kinase [Aliidongia sp.]HEV2676644.1 serine/threonine-protein kinase [Aliidongia sp.]
MAKPAAAMGGAKSTSVRLHDRFDILNDVPLNDLRSGGTGAFAVEDLRSAGASFFALIADPALPPRAQALTALRIMKHPAVLTPIDFGPVDWAPADRRCLALICERPAGGRLVSSNDQVITPWSDDDVLHRLIQPLFPGLKALATENIAHRAIRPTNILFRDPARRQAILGECFTAPTGFDQPLAYETIENAMTMPGGRGVGTAADDLYSLGVTILYLMLGRTPGGPLTDEQLIDEKIRRGSYAALSGELRLSGSLLELLRGLLVDDPSDRWTVREMDMWLQGRRMSPKSPAGSPRAVRPLELGKEQIFTARGAGRMLVRQGDQAVHLIRGHHLEVWLQRTLAYKPTTDAFALAMADADDTAGTAGVHDARLIARVVMALDPSGPIRYRDVAVTPEGLGCVLALTLTRQKDVRPLIEIVMGRLPQFWIRCQPIPKSDHPVMSIEFDRMRRMLDDHRPGLGLERLVYDANPMLHCLSPLIERDYVDQASDLLPALEQAVLDGKIESLAVDRHIAAFVANRSKNLDDQVLTALGQPDAATRLLGQIYLLAFLQAQSGPPSVPALTQLLGRQATPVIERYRSRPTRDRLDSHLAAVLAEGSLVKLVHFLDSLEERQHDAQRFTLARRQFGRASAGLHAIETERLRLPETSTELGGVIAAAVSTVVGVIAVAMSLFHFGML